LWRGAGGTREEPNGAARTRAVRLSSRPAAALPKIRRVTEASAGHVEPHFEQRARWRAGLVSLTVALLLLGAKYAAWLLTGSTAVLSDAMEGIVNVLTALFALGGLAYAGIPADRNHPYGHGKIEFFAAAFEGGMIAFAALLIVWEAVQALAHGPELHQLDLGVLIIAAAGSANALLGLYLLRTGRRLRSLTLEADGQHVLSDFWTSVGVMAGLLLVRLTGHLWIDPVFAIVVALLLLRTGARLVRVAAGGLLDEEDTQLVQRLVQVLDQGLGNGVIRVHHLRAIRAGRIAHVSAHLVVPEFWSVERAHDLAEALAAGVRRDLGGDTDITFHTDPCHRGYCAMCDVDICSVRAQPFGGRPPLTVEEVVQPDRRPLPVANGAR
jgi:cation diffusion facilitator family transporter